MHRILRSPVWVLPVLVFCLGCESDSSSGPGPTPPILVDVLINDGSPYTLTRNVTVTAVCGDNEEPAAIMISEAADFPDAVWQDFTDEAVYELSDGDGLKTVHVRVKDAAGNTSEGLSATIALAATTTVVGLTPLAGETRPGTFYPSSVTLELWLANVTDMYSAVFELSFDPELLTATAVEVDFSGHILRSTGASLFVSNNSFDNDAGRILAGALPLQSGFEGVTGSGSFARVTFTPTEASATSNPVGFVEGEWSVVNVIQEQGPPAPATGLLFIDGEVVP